MVDGVAEFRRFMYQTVPDAVRIAARDALEKGAQELVDMIRSLAPVEDGFLLASIGWTWGDPPKGSIALDDIAPAEDPSMRIVVYAGSELAFYARWVEFGTSKAPAHPFFWPAYRAMRSRIKSRITRAINKAIRSL